MVVQQSIYHERQSRQLCALHVLNNLFQDPNAFKQKDLDSICVELSPGHWINPHKSILGLGNYDVNVIMAALQKKGFEAVWFDKRRDPAIINMSAVFGFILNIPGQNKVLHWVPWPFGRKHWIAIRKIDHLNEYFNLDSNFEAPKAIGSENDLLSFFRCQIETKDREILLIVTKSVAEKELWRKEVQECLEKSAADDKPKEDLVVHLPDTE